MALSCRQKPCIMSVIYCSRLVNVYIANWKITMLLVGKLTNFRLAHFQHQTVNKLPEYKCPSNPMKPPYFPVGFPQIFGYLWSSNQKPSVFRPQSQISGALGCPGIQGVGEPSPLSHHHDRHAGTVPAPGGGHRAGDDGYDRPRVEVCRNHWLQRGEFGRIPSPSF